MANPALQQIEGKYEILEKLREGGMGAIYKVRHRLLDEVRVVKLMRPQLKADEDLKARFIREARAAVKLRHPNIAHLYDFSMDEQGTAFMVMEYIEGRNLEELLKKRGRQTVSVVLDIGIQSLRALGYLHEKGFAHRDISPDNLMLTKDVDGTPLVKLIDLGIAKSLKSDEELTFKTQQGVFLGKMRYASPEHFGGPQGDAVVDSRSDLYSLGIVLYELCTGRCAISGKDSHSMIAGHLFRPPRNFTDTDPGERVPPRLRSAILKSLAKAPEDRFPDAASFSAPLIAIQSEWQELESAEDLAKTQVLPVPGSSPGQERVSPGSTQEKLDLQFEMGTTPLPSALADEDTPKGRKARAAALVEGARILAEHDKCEEARTQVLVALDLDPTSGGALDLLEKLKDRTQNRVADIAVAKQAVEKRLARGKLEGASRPRPIWKRFAAVGVVILTGVLVFVSYKVSTRTAAPELTAAGGSSGLEEPIPSATQPGPEQAEALGREIVPPPGASSKTPTREVSPAVPEPDRGTTRKPTEAAVQTQVADKKIDQPDPEPVTPSVEKPPPSVSSVAEKSSGEPERSAATQRAAVARALQQFSLAYESRNADGLRTIWPTIASKKFQAIKESFAQAKAITMTLDECDIQVSGDRAQAHCQLRQTYQPKKGRHQSVARAASLSLRYDKRWTIVDYR